MCVLGSIHLIIVHGKYDSGDSSSSQSQVLWVGGAGDGGGVGWNGACVGIQ